MNSLEGLLNITDSVLNSSSKWDCQDTKQKNTKLTLNLASL